MIATGLQPIIVALTAASPPGAAVAAARLINTIDFSEMSPYASAWEAVAVDFYPQSSRHILTDPAIVAKVRTLRDRLLSRWLGAESAVTKDQLYAEALTLAPDPGSALVLCYHVCQLFSRGFVTVYWQRVKDWINDGNVLVPGTTVRPTGDPVTDDDYTTGIDFYRPLELNAALPGEVLRLNGRDSIFYLLFDKNEEWGVADPGDWYHFFLMASIAYYAATGRVTDRNCTGKRCSATHCRPCEKHLPRNAKRRTTARSSAHFDGSLRRRLALGERALVRRRWHLR